ncbi:MAG: hypothetical protein NTZ19_14460 [Bacteroidetes bacterium]|nr:hypothetical protein [Bacteroidota bacterium]
MKKSFLFVFILWGTINSVKSQSIIINGLKFIPDTTIDLQKSLAFIKEVMGQDLSNENLILDNNPKIFNPLNCFDQILIDDYYLKKDEWLYIQDIRIPQLENWASKYVLAPNSKNSNAEKVDSKRKIISWPYFYKIKKGKGLCDNEYYYSVPIFLRNDEKSKYCIFYFRNECGLDCGMADLAIYINNNGRWIKLKRYCGWIS